MTIQQLQKRVEEIVAHLNSDPFLSRDDKEELHKELSETVTKIASFRAMSATESKALSS